MSTIMVTAALHFCSSKLHFTSNTNILGFAFEVEEGSLILLKDEVWFINENSALTDGSQLFCALGFL